MTTLRSKVAKQRNQTNSNLLGMDQGGCAELCNNHEHSRPGPNIFFRVGPPVKSQASSFKLDRVQVIGYSKIRK